MITNGWQLYDGWQRWLQVRAGRPTPPLLHIEWREWRRAASEGVSCMVTGCCMIISKSNIFLVVALCSLFVFGFFVCVPF